jgi:hypothetical protein
MPAHANLLSAGVGAGAQLLLTVAVLLGMLAMVVLYPLTGSWNILCIHMYGFIGSMGGSGFFLAVIWSDLELIGAHEPHFGIFLVFGFWEII